MKTPRLKKVKKKLNFQDIWLVSGQNRTRAITHVFVPGSVFFPTNSMVERYLKTACEESELTCLESVSHFCTV